jgi:hypothetical protein
MPVYCDDDWPWFQQTEQYSLAGSLPGVRKGSSGLSACSGMDVSMPGSRI